MRLSDLISETLRSLTANKLRSGLTILGIVVGIASVIALLAIGRGAQASIEESISGIGSNLLVVQPGASGGDGFGTQSVSASSKALTLEDAEALAALDLISGVDPYVQSAGQLVSPESAASAQIIGVTPAHASVQNLEIAIGAFLSERDVRASSQVVVLGSQLAEDLFGEGVNPVGEHVRHGDMRLRVIGVFAEKGLGLSNTDSSAFIPLTTHQRRVSGGEELSSITLAVSDVERMAEAEASVESKLLEVRGIDDPEDADFQIRNMTELLDTVTQVTSMLTGLLAAIAGISLLVGGIGIMNMMLTTVTERTREIGLRKAIGADEGVIATQFLTESVVLTLLGGVIGIVVGWAISSVAGSLISIVPIVSLNAIALAVGICAFVGVVFGFYPARRAARLSPIEALRYQ
ncbi:MAG: ABC transporter permease [Clostridiales bacterium]|nr:ABC transporter permease [Clostridiales bacterium]